MRSAVAEGLLDSGIRAAAVAEGQCCLTEKPNLEIVLTAGAADLAEALQASEASAPSRPKAAEVKARRER